MRSEWNLLADDDGPHAMAVKAWDGEIVAFRRERDKRWEMVWTSDGDGGLTIRALVHRFERLGVDDAAVGSEALAGCASHDGAVAIWQAIEKTLPEYWAAHRCADEAPPSAFVGPDPF